MASLLSNLYQTFTSWKARRDNPNQITAAQLAAENKTTTTNALKQYAPKNVLSVSYAGNCLDIRNPALPLTSRTGFTFTHPSFEGMFAGIDVTVQGRTVDLAQLTSDFRSRTGYLYLNYDGTNVSWKYQANSGADSGTSIRVGSVTCDASTITVLTLNKTFLLGTTRMMG